MTLRAARPLGFVLPLVLLLLTSGPGHSQKKKAEPPSPSGPTLAPLAVTGVQRGQAVDLTLTGTGLAQPAGVDLGTRAEVSIDAKESDGTKLRVKLTVPADTPVGAYPLRVAAAGGVSNVRLFCVDDLPPVAEGDKNHSPAEAQTVPVPCVVAGRVEAEQADYFKIHAEAGQHLSFDLLGQRLGSALDAQVTLYDAKTRRQLAYENDSPGANSDPRLRYTFKEAGDYLIAVRDVLHRGGADYFYRLRVGDLPLATAPVPLAARRGGKARVEFAGPAVDGVAPVEVDVPDAPERAGVLVHPKGPGGLSGWPVTLAASDHDEGAEQEPNDTPAQATRLSVPGGVTGRFARGGDVDCYVFAARKGQKYFADVRTLELASPTLAYLIFKNAKTGAELAKTNPQAPPPADQRLEFTAAEDGDLVLEVQHLTLAGGPAEVYHLAVRPAADFDLALAVDRVDAAPGGVAPLLVQISRRGYAGPVELSVRGLPGTAGEPALSGSAAVKAGQTTALVPVPLPADLPHGAYAFAVVGKATLDGAAVARLASVRAPLLQSLGNLPVPPYLLQSRVALGVRAKAPFSLAAKLSPPDPSPGAPATVVVSATRDAGFDGEIALGAPLGLPPTVPAPKVPAVVKGKAEASFALDLNAKTPAGDYVLLLSGRGNGVADVVPLTFTLGPPFELKAEPLTLAAGAKAKLKVSAHRRAGYKGPITLEIRKLPAGVSAAAATIPAEKDAAEVDVTAAPTAAAAEKADVEVAGTATALNNQQAVSPAFAVTVKK